MSNSQNTEGASAIRNIEPQRELVLYFRQGQIMLLHDAPLHCLLWVCEGFISIADFRLSLEKAMQITEKHQVRAWILGLENASLSSSDNYFTPAIMAQIIKEGLQKLLLVVNNSIFDNEELLRLDKKKVSERDFIAYFSSTEKAWQCLAKGH